MTTPMITPADDELEALMSQLEAETGVSAVVTPAVTVAPVTAVEVEEDLTGLEELEGLTAVEDPDPTVTPVKDDGMFNADELAEMEELETISAAVKPKADLSGLQGQLAGLKTTGVQEEVLVDDIIPPTPDAELAALEAELLTESAASVVEEAAVVVEVVTVEPVTAEAVALAATVATVATKTTAPKTTAPPSATPIPGSAPKGLNFFIDANAFREETQIKGHDLDTCFMQQSSLRAYYGTLAARAEAQASLCKTKFEVLEARLYDHHRKTLTDGGAKVTEKMVENAVKTDPRWLAGKENVIEADTIANVNKALAISLADRRDMLYQLGADRRDEARGQSRLLAAQGDRENMAERAKTSAANALNNR